MPRIKPIGHEDHLSVVGHLDELRSRLMVALAAFLVAFGLTTWQSDLVLALVNAPLPGDMQPITLGPAEPFITTLKNAAYAAILITLPVLLYQAYAFLVPALKPSERRVALPLLLMVPFLFVGGVVFCYLVVLPPALDFLLGFNSSQFDAQLRASDYYDFATLTMIAMGLGFQVPVAVLVLTRLGVVTVDKLRRSRRYAVLAIAVTAALLPTLDPVTLVLEMIPLMLLYELSIQLARLFAPGDHAAGASSLRPPDKAAAG
jgi:sec-independent protein translocase protein TatC